MTQTGLLAFQDGPDRFAVLQDDPVRFAGRQDDADSQLLIDRSGLKLPIGLCYNFKLRLRCWGVLKVKKEIVYIFLYNFISQYFAKFKYLVQKKRQGKVSKRIIYCTKLLHHNDILE